MKTPKKMGTSPSEKLNKSSGGLVKKNVAAKKLSMKNAKEALNNSQSFNMVKTPLKGKKSLAETPKSNGMSPAKGKKSMGTPGPKMNGATPKKGPKTPKNVSPEVKLGLNIEKILESPKSPKSPKFGGKKKQERPKVNLAKPPRGPPSAPFLKKDAVTGAVKALIETSKKEAKDKKDILDNQSIFLFNINFFKVPLVGRGVIRASLPFPFRENTDIALIVSDLNKDKDGDPDDTIDHFKQLLSKLGVNSITEIIPYKKLRTEYTQIEQKRKLVNRFDIMLVDSKIAHRVPTLLKRSITRKKNIVPVKLNKDGKVKNVINTALKKVTMCLHRRGLTLTTQFGHSEMEINHLVDNIFSLARVFQDINTFSQGVANIRSVQIKTPKGVPLPVYVSNLNPNHVKQDIIKKGPKSQPVTGELTTAENKMVTVFPDGKVVTKKIKSKNDIKNEKKKEEAKEDKSEDDDDLILETTSGDIELDDDDDDEEDDDDLSDLDLDIGSDIDEDDEDDSDDDEENEEPSEKSTKALKGKRALPKMDAGSDESSEDDEEIEAAEQEFLQELRQQQDAIAKKRKVDNKQKGKKDAVTEEKKEKVAPAKKAKVEKEGAQQGKKFNKGANNASPKFNKNNPKKFGGKPDGQSPKNKFGGKPNNKQSPKKGGKPNKFQKGGKGKSP